MPKQQRRIFQQNSKNQMVQLYENENVERITVPVEMLPTVEAALLNIIRL